ncbi:hypothetical protein FSP39_021788 [Pinctada imbricata]|uniref:Sulfatase N-terminal domain-containing protein n=1 Tax=Pinctada imbricata TaxID=66713 RepID=A0AA89BWC9_PINIB|nr:hypothetical protein FSP39_021788 [Pinctada imbricata]
MVRGVKVNYLHFLMFMLLLPADGAIRPHIILIVADDLGWNDVSFHGSNQIPTPNMDSLAYGGIILNNYYVSPICTPTRGALLSGRHPVHTGEYHGGIILNNYYVSPICTPTRGALLSGRHPVHTGEYHGGIILNNYYVSPIRTPTRGALLSGRYPVHTGEYHGGIILNNYYVSPICTPTRGALLSGRHPVHTDEYHGGIILNKYYVSPICTPTRGALLSGRHPLHTGEYHGGIILNNYYVSPICTPTRGALLSGRHPVHTGEYHGGIILNNYYVSPICTPTRGVLLSGRYPVHTGEYHGGIILNNYYVSPICTPTRGVLLSGRYPVHTGEYHGGIILNNYYVSLICTPTRGVLLSGRHPVHTGEYHGGIILNNYYVSLICTPTSGALLSGIHPIHWHLGFHRKEFTPMYRGFETHYGYYLGCGDYYDHTSEQNEEYYGFDFWRNETVDFSGIGQYSTDLFKNEAINILKHHNQSEPLFLYLPFQAPHNGNNPTGKSLQAPSKIINRFKNIKNTQRRTYAGMVSSLDDAVGEIMNKLKSLGMYDNSIIAFSTDNGGPANGLDKNAASNFPLRGVKTTLWEGGVRGVGFIHSPLLKTKGYVSQQMMHVTDWLPTLYTAAGGNPGDIKVTDGIDQWEVLSQNGTTKREELLHNIDPLKKKAAIRVGDYKLLTGHINMKWDGWYPPWTESNEVKVQIMLNNLDLSSGVSDYISSGVFYSNSEFSNTEKYSSVQEKTVLKWYTKGTPVKIKCGQKPVNASTNCDPVKSPCLYHILTDPCEYHNIADENKDIVNKLLTQLNKWASTMVEPGNKPADPAGNPRNHGGIWRPWLD